MTPKFRIVESGGAPRAVFEEEPEPRQGLLFDLIHDFDRQEDLVLREIAKAEAGATVLDLYNNYITAELYPDGRVILEELRYSAKDEAERGPPARTEITLQEARQLILDWLEAKKRWYAEHGAEREEAHSLKREKENGHR